jgi:hypothetical protein
VTDFRQLKVSRKAHQLALDTYRVTVAFPKEEMYGLTSHSGARLLPLERTSPRVVVGVQMARCAIFCRSLVGRQVRWNIKFCSLETYIF